MAFMIFSPLGKKSPYDIRTANTLINQVWQEFVMLRHRPASYIAAPKSTGQWIDQARTYFLDAAQSNWRTAGLLYYYSFLNLAKACLVAKRKFTFKTLNATSIYHGLRAELQTLNNITDFEIQIYPPTHRGWNNIFASLYETISGQDWPYTDKISIKFAEVAGYCSDVSHELESLFKIKKLVIPVQSLLRFSENETWFEMLIQNPDLTAIQQQIKDWDLEIISGTKFSNSDKVDWLHSLRTTAEFISISTCFRGSKRSINNGNTADAIKVVAEEAVKKLEPFAFPPVSQDPNFIHWRFYPKLSLLNKSIPWHPILSDYLFAFVLSSILRYQPQFLDQKSPNYFFSEAWCSQSALSAARYFLMLFTSPPLTIETY